MAAKANAGAGMLGWAHASAIERVLVSRSRRVLSGLLFLASTVAMPLIAATHEFEVLTKNGKPIPGAVVYIESLDGPVSSPAVLGVMDQVDRQFLPHILIVQRGAEVAFPNSDSIKHHVFSFSEAKTFEIKLYKGAATEPVRFDRTGEVELGCNVHDWMLGYIYVIDTPFFARTDARGVATIDAPPGRYQLGAWHPRIQDDAEALKQEITSDGLRHRIQLVQPLLASYDPEAADDFADY